MDKWEWTSSIHVRSRTYLTLLFCLNIHLAPTLLRWLPRTLLMTKIVLRGQCVERRRTTKYTLSFGAPSFDTVQWFRVKLCISATHELCVFFYLRQHQRFFEDHCFDKLVMWWESRKSPGIRLNEGSECECFMCNYKKTIFPPNGHILLKSHTHLKITSCHCSFFPPSVPTPLSLYSRKHIYLISL